jgi:argininosuccinate lyase
MPQKKNPDAAELIRGKTGRVYGNLINLLSVMKALPLAYNHDMQEDKEPLFDTVDTIKKSLFLMSQMIKTISIHRDNMTTSLEGDFSTATELADYLVKQGLSFRKAHKIVGEIVLFCINNKKSLHQLTLQEFKSFHKTFTDEIVKLTNPIEAVNAKTSYGGTSLDKVKISIAKAKEILK